MATIERTNNNIEKGGRSLTSESLGNLQENVRDNQDIITQTKDELGDVQTGILGSRQGNSSFRNNPESNNPYPQIEEVGNIRTYEGFLTALDKLISDIKDTKKDAKLGRGHWRNRNRPTKAGRESLKHAEKTLGQYLKTLEALRKNITKGNRREISEYDISQLKTYRNRYRDAISDVDKGNRGELSNESSGLYNSPETSKKSNKQQERILNFTRNLNTIIKEGAVLNILNKTESQAKEFLTRIAEGRYTAADYNEYQLYSTQLNPIFSQYGIPYPTPNGITIDHQSDTPQILEIPTPSNNPETTDYSKLSLGESFSKGGIFGALNNLLSMTNMTDKQRAGRQTAVGLATIGGLIYGGYKFFTSKADWKRKVGIPVGLTLLSNSVTGKNPISLLKGLFTGGQDREDLKQQLGLATDNFSNTPAGNIALASNTGLALYPATTKVQDLRSMSIHFAKNPQERSTFRTQAISKLENSGSRQMVESFRAKFQDDNFDQRKWDERLASMGITETTNQNLSVHEILTINAYNSSQILRYCETNGLKEKNNSGLKTFIQQKNDRQEAITQEELQAHKNERFEPITQNKTAAIQKIEDKVQNLSLSDEKKSELILALTEFYNNKPENNKPNIDNILLQTNGNILTFSSNQNPEGVNIDLNGNYLKGFGNTNKNNYNIAFNNLTELIAAADLTNLILGITKRKTPNSYDNIFVHRNIGRGIFFDDSGKLTDLDTRILSTGRRGASQNHPTIQNHLDEYTQYLTRQRIEANKVNLTHYPYLKDMEIDFINEAQTKELNERLQKIAEHFKFASGISSGEPFSFSNNGDLIFTHIDGQEEIVDKNENGENIKINIKGYTTLTNEENKTKFLKHLNSDNKYYNKNN